MERQSVWRLGLVLWGVAALFALGTAQAGTLRFRYLVKSPTAMMVPGDARELAGWLAQNGFDIAGFNFHKSEIEVITDEIGLARITQAGLKGRVLLVQEAQSTLSVDEHYYNPDRIAARLNALHLKYPSLTRVEQVGTSLQGRPILALLVSSTPVAGDAKMLAKPSLLVDGQHHAREIQTSHVALDIAETLLSEYATVASTQVLVDRWNIWVLPMVNLDGTNIVFSTDNMWRKNARGNFGVDINRNYPYKWAGCSGSSNSSGAQDYHGDSPASEPETKALMHLAELAHPAASLSYHSYSELVLYPFGCDGVLSGENALEEKVAGELANLLPTDDGNGKYTPGTPWQILYAVDGDSMDYIHSQYGALSYTFEVNQDFQPSWSLMNQTLAKHRAAWKYFLKRADAGLVRLQVIDAKTDKPVQATVSIASIPHVQGEQAFSTNAAGNFFKVLDAGTYIFNVSLVDGRSTQISVTTAAAGGTGNSWTKVVVP